MVRTRVRLVGTVGVERDDLGLVTSTSKVRQTVLALLATTPGRTGPVEVLVDEVWAAGGLPANPRATLQTREIDAQHDTAAVLGDGFVPCLVLRRACAVERRRPLDERQRLVPLAGVRVVHLLKHRATGGVVVCLGAQ